MQNFEFKLSIIIEITCAIGGLNGFYALFRMAKDTPARKNTIYLCIFYFVMSVTFFVRAFCFERQ